MSENQVEKMNVTDGVKREYNRQIRIWPAILIALAQITAIMLFARFGRTNIHNGIALGGIPAVSFILILVWWLGFSRVPWRSRLVGFVMFCLAVAAVIFSQRSVNMGGMLLAVALPYMVYCIVLTLILTIPVHWPIRKWLVLLVLLVCTGVFCAKRVDELGGDLQPVVSWRWQQTIEERSEALSHAITQKTADLPETVTSEDWPDFLGGPERTDTISGITFSTDWSTPPREVWRQPIGPAGLLLSVSATICSPRNNGERKNL